jgi:hypothetical protein
MKSLVFFSLIFMLVWAPYINVGIGFFGDTQVAIALLVIALSGFAPWRNIPQAIKWVLMAICLLSGYAALLAVGYERLIYVPALRLMRAAIVCYACWCVVFGVYRQWGVEADRLIVRALYLGIALHGLLMVAQFVQPQFREAMTKWTFASEGVEINLRTRMPGLTNGGGAQLSTFMSIGFLLFPYCYATAEGWLTKSILAAGASIIGIAVVLSGRSGVYTAVFLFPLMVMLVGYFYREGGGLLQFIIRILGLVGVILTCGTALFLLDSLLRGSIGGSDYADYAFERNLDMFLNSDEGFVQNSTVSELWTHHVLFPSDLETFLKGNLENMDHSQGAGGAAKRDVDSDVGYVRLLFSFGFFGSMLHYAIYIGMIIELWKVRRIDPVMPSIAIFILALILIFHAKEVFVFTRIGWSICVTLYCAAVYSASLRVRKLKRLTNRERMLSLTIVQKGA